jgi:hypothetical protein
MRRKDIRLQLSEISPLPHVGRLPQAVEFDRGSLAPDWRYLYVAIGQGRRCCGQARLRVVDDVTVSEEYRVQLVDYGIARP